jgi:multiple sugar transport system substrate-binding protein
MTLRRGRATRRGFLGAVPPLAALASCGRSRSGSDPPPLSLLVPAAEREVWGPLGAGFEAARPGARIQLVEGPNDTDLRENLYTAALLAGDDSFDLVLMDVTWMPKLAGAGWLLPLGEDLVAETEALLPAAVAAGRYRGRLYRVPTRTDVGVLYYRRDWLEKEGVPPPETFEDLVRVARALQSPPDRWGFVWQGSQYEGLVCVFLEVLHGHGGFWVDAETLAVGLDEPPAMAAVEFLRSCRAGAAISPPGVTTYKEEQSRRLFQDGRAVFLRNWPYVWRLAQAQGSPLAGRVGVRSMVHLPGVSGAGTLGGWGLGISRFSRQPDLASEFIRYAVSLPGQRTICLRSGYAPSRLEAYEDRELVAANPFLGALLRIHARAVPRPAISRYALVSDILQRHLSAALAGLATAAEAMRSASRETRQVFGSDGPSPGRHGAAA